MTTALHNNSLVVDISVTEDSWPPLEVQVQSAIEKIFVRIAYDMSVPVVVSVVLTNDTFIQSLNNTYRNKDKPTNVLSFPQEHDAIFGERNLGDVVLAYETIYAEAEAQDKSFEDHALHMVIHGTLHLLGYDHENETQAKDMESLEIAILDDLGIKNPYELGYTVC